MQPEHQRKVSGTRADLRRLRDPEEIHELYVDGKRLGSLAGLERASHLRSLRLTRMHEPDLSVVTSLPLEWVRIENLTGDVDYTPIERLHSLKRLEIHMAARSHAESVGRLRLPTGLTNLILEWPDSPAVRFHLPWPELPPQLTQMGLLNFNLSDEDVERICRGNGGRFSQLAANLTDAQIPRLFACLPETLVLPVFEDAPGIEIREVRYDDGREGFEFDSDVAGLWDLESAIEAAEALEEELERTAPEIARRIDISLGGGSLWIFGARRDDVEAVRDLVLQCPDDN